MVILCCSFGFSQDFEYTITDANMTVQVGADICSSVMESGDLLGAFFTNGAGELQNAGYLPFEGDQLAIAVWASESGFDNGFSAGDDIQWAMYDSSEGTTDTTATLTPASTDYFSSSSNSLSVVVTDLNDAPELAGVTTSLGTITENDGDSSADDVTTFDLASQLSSLITDTDTTSAFNNLGVAVTSVSTTNGRWDYSTAGSSGPWTERGSRAARRWRGRRSAGTPSSSCQGTR